MKTILILGASSDVGLACAEVFAANKYNIQLAGRSASRFKSIETDLAIKHGIEVHSFEFDADKYETHPAFFEALPVKPDVVLCMFGYLGKQEEAEINFSESLKIISSNYTGAVSILNVVANYFAGKKTGTIIGVSSVAGERGRLSNYTYGSAKAGFTAYLSGLRNRMYHHGVHVITVKPGFMDTRMTEGLNLPKPLTASPVMAAKAIYGAYRKKKNVVYVKAVWQVIMLVIRNIPEFVFKRLKM